MSSYAYIHPVEDIYDTICISQSNGYYQVFALKALESEVFIDRSPLRIGYMEFVPGQKYPRFGSNKKTSAGFISYDGVPLVFVGTYRGHAYSRRREDHSSSSRILGASGRGRST